MKLIIPSRALEQHLIILGKTGAGKSSALRHMVEWLLHHQKRLCIVDPKGDWWGLKFSSDGKSEGLPVILFGDFKNDQASDVPINDRSGQHLAELIADGNRPCVIGMRGWQLAQMTRFWIDFAGGLFSRNKGELYVVGDEFHNFAPKGQIKGREGNTTMCLHWSNRMLSEGRGLGIVCLLASQRPQKVHNDTLTSCETLCAMRVIHKADRQAVKDWIDGCGDPERGNAVLNGLAGMERGEAYVWSPEINFGPERLKFPMFTTFDSFAPPQLQKKVSSARWSNVDLDAVKKKLEGVIAEAKANDPAELKRQIRELEHNLKVKVQEMDRWKQSPEVKHAEPIKVPVFDDDCRKLLDKVDKACSDTIEESHTRAMAFQEIVKQLNTMRGEILSRISNIRPAVIHSHRVTRPLGTRADLKRIDRTHSAVMVNGDGDSNINSTQQRILDALAWFESVGNPQPSTLQVGAVALIDSTGGYFSNMVGPLSASGLIDRGNGTITLTDAGRKIARVPDNISTLADYHSMLCERVRKLKNAGGKTVEMLQVIIAQGPKGEITTEEIGQQVQVDHTGGYFSNLIGPLGGLGLIERDRGIVRPTEILFPPGLK